LRGITNFFKRLGAAVREERRLAIGVPSLAFAILGLMLGIAHEKQVAWLGEAGPRIFALVEIGLCFLLIALFVRFLVNICRRLRLTEGDVFLPSAFLCRAGVSRDEVRHINVKLVHRIFPDAPIPPDHGLTAHAKNPQRLVVLVKKDTDEIAGWASMWPVSKKVGQAIESGRRNDDDLSPADLLPTHRNGSTTYLLMRAFAVLPEHRIGRENLALKLGCFVLAHIIDEFIRTSDRTIRLVAIAYTEEGAKMCHAIGLKENGHLADYGPKLGKKPVWVADVTMKDLYRRLGER
jgi:hypothetical protein